MQTANTYCFLVHLLANNPDVEERLYSEIIAVVQNHHESVTAAAAAAAADASQFKYLNCVIKEALR